MAKKIISPLWYDLALDERGVKVTHDNPKVLAYYADSGFKDVRHDSVPWCAAFVGAMLHRAGVEPSGSLMARSYLKWGTKLKAPKHGCVVVFSRPGSSFLGHVAFFDHSVGDKVMVFGGNQSHRVSFGLFPKSRVLGYRWPNLEEIVHG
jgi:uncharacterized protein (TIGR02594 family)